MEIKSNQAKLLGWVLIFLAGFLLGRYADGQQPVQLAYTEPLDVFKTVAHVPVDNEELELIYKNAEDDVAYYRYIGPRDIVSIGDTVLLYDGTEGIVTSTSINGFTVKLDCQIFQGLSGMAILQEEHQIGYVSTLLDTGEVYCIWS